jgi:hypothetical protein
VEANKMIQYRELERMQLISKQELHEQERTIPHALYMLHRDFGRGIFEKTIAQNDTEGFIVCKLPTGKMQFKKYTVKDEMVFCLGHRYSIGFNAGIVK